MLAFKDLCTSFWATTANKF